MIFSTLLGEINAHKVQLVSYHQKTNGLLIRIVVNNVPKAGNITGWVGQENWFYLTINEAVLGENVLDNLKAKSPLLEIEGIQNKESVQIGFLLEHSIVDFEIFHSTSSRVFLVQIWRELDGQTVTDIKHSEKDNINKIFSLPKQEATGQPFHQSFVYAQEKYGTEKYFVWYDNWYSTESDDNSVGLVELDIWDKHWAGNEKIDILTADDISDRSVTDEKKDEIQSLKFGPPAPYNVFANTTKNNTENPDPNPVVESIDSSLRSVPQKPPQPQKSLLNKKERPKLKAKKVKQKKSAKRKPKKKEKKQLQYTKIPETKRLAYHLLPDISSRKTFLKIRCDLLDVFVYLDGKKMGKTPLTSRVPVTPGWQRIRIDIPGAPKRNQYGIPMPDYRDVYVTKGRTQKVTFKFLQDKVEDSG